MANIYEVAKRAGVSTATVSRVLSQPDVVAPDTRGAASWPAVERLGFTPNSAAKNLRTLRTRKLLVTVPDISNPFFSLILQGIEDAAQREGYSVLVGDTQHDQKREERYALMLKRKEADGLIFLGHRLPKQAAELVRAMPAGKAPVVNGCEFSPAPRHPQRAHRQRHGRGRCDGSSLSPRPPPDRHRHRTAGQSAQPGSPARRDSARAKKARAERDFDRRQRRLFDRVRHGGGGRLLGREDPPTAIFCFNDEMAMGVIETARRHKLRIPDDLSVVGSTISAMRATSTRR